MGRHANVAIFVPNAGCPHRCSFCDQRRIAGVQTMPTRDDVRAACETAVSTMRTDASQSEIAFFGGSFTAIDRRVMCSLLEAAAPFVRAGKFCGIRLSTRPDYIDAEVLDLLKSYGVTAVELGAQSMDDRVLALNERGHTAADVVNASECIRGAGIELGLQMMTGLYGSSDEIDRMTARRLAELRPDTVRIYPTLVMEHTALADLYRAGSYVPPSLEQTVSLCADLLRFFEREKGIPVIRLGLHAEAEMQKGMLAGPWHPAFRELCEGELYYRQALALLRREMPGGGAASLAVNPRALSQIIGQNRRNLAKFAQAGYTVKAVGNADVAEGEVKRLSMGSYTP